VIEQGTPSIEQGLRRIRIRRWLSWGLFAGWLPFGISVSKLPTSSAVEAMAVHELWAAALRGVSSLS
jgi:hypothetical protein